MDARSCSQKLIKIAICNFASCHLIHFKVLREWPSAEVPRLGACPPAPLRLAVGAGPRPSHCEPQDGLGSELPCYWYPCEPRHQVGNDQFYLPELLWRKLGNQREASLLGKAMQVVLGRPTEERSF